MPTTDDLVFSSASGLAAAIRRRDVSAMEVVDAHLAQISTYNPRLNTIVTLDADRAMQRARDADAALARGEVWGPLHGVPVTLKEHHAVAGLRNTYGGQADRLAYVCSEDSVVPFKLKSAGATILGMTNFYVRGSESVFGSSNNPWDLLRTAGTSSAGAGAAIAAGLSPLDVGSDGLASVLGPAHHCGIYGMRSTEGRVSLAGIVSPPPARFLRAIMVLGPLARSVEDLRLGLQIIQGPCELDPTIPPAHWQTATEPVIRNLRVAWTSTFPGTRIAGDIRAAIEKFVQELSRAGAHVEHRPPSEELIQQGTLCNEMFGLMFAAFAQPKEGVLPPSLSDWFLALQRREVFIRAWDHYFADWDVLICPTVWAVAYRHDEGSFLVDGQALSPEERRVSPFTAVCLTGRPALTMPLAHDPQGMPIGVTLVGRHWGDEKLLAIAEALLPMTGGYRRPPGF